MMDALTWNSFHAQQAIEYGMRRNEELPLWHPEPH
jgi:hypothetical protein